MASRVQMGAPGVPWRFAVLGGATAGLALSPARPRWERGTSPGRCWCSGWPPGSASSSRAPAKPAPRVRSGSRCLRSSRRPPGWPWASFASAAIDGGAFHGPIGRPATARGFVTAVPRRSRGEVSVRIQTADGRLAVEASEPVPDLPIGRQVERHRHASRARALGGRLPGALRHPPGPRRRPAPAHRRAPRGARRRWRIASATAPSWPSGRGTPDGGGSAPARLRARRGRPHRRRPPSTTSSAPGSPTCSPSSGENVMLLALLAVPLWRCSGVPLRARLLVRPRPDRDLRAGHRRGRRRSSAPASWARPGSSPRWPERPRSRWYAVLLAAFVTLAINPRAERRRRLAAQLRGRDRDHAVGGADSRRPAGTGRGRGRAGGRRLAARPGRGRRGDDRGDARHGAADGARLRRGLDRVRCPRTCSRCPPWRR